MIAASAGRDAIVSMLIGYGADVNSTNEGGQTSLHYAASRNRYEVLEKCQIGATIEYRATLEDFLLKWLGGSSVKEKYCKAHLETERNKTSSPRVVLKDLMIENEKGIYF